ncbi:GNAT family N-acetyltransferase [Allorhodopirellula heiligendammensis]|uniref:N-acetyltransferase YafP n=1 Tax=Allorhodopirellula heiligendammensis TaxID=2714739 RepID=A0A5C6C509_9BACT|nr:GNAT family N-acetyltransferase [Allorhodopirellula heiligendammensis]TWU17889.1 putative N-acetyltransferase YafP [Allorhodopirellula heiligendammensis]
MNSALQIRKFVSADGDSCHQLFYDTVRRVNCRDYSTVQVDAWAGAVLDAETWVRRFDGNSAYVVERDGAIVGFTDMTPDGYLDRLFVSADHQRQGIATMLLRAIKSAAKNDSLTRIHTQASITAKPFFLSRGFKIVAEQTVECLGVELTNFVMELTLRD